MLLPGPVAWEWFCPVASRSSTTSSISWAGSTPSRTQGKAPTRSGSLLLLPPGYRRPLSCLFRSATYPRRPSAASSTQVGAAISRLAFLPILQTLLFITRWRILSARYNLYRGPRGRRGRLTSTARCGSWAGAEPRPIPQMRWTSLFRGKAGGLARRLLLRGATSPPTPTARPGFGWQAGTITLSQAIH